MSNLNKIKQDVAKIKQSLDKRLRQDGGPGSGNWGHEGRPGEIGGSAEGGGKHNRWNDIDDGYTSWTKQRKSYLQEHNLSEKEWNFVKNTDNAIVKVGNRTYKVDEKDGVFRDVATGKIASPPADKPCRVILPQSSNTNFVFTKADKLAMGLRKDDMKYAYRPKTAKESYDKYVVTSGKQWKSLKAGEKRALYMYTSENYEHMNNALRDETIEPSGTLKTWINNATKALDKTEMEQDSILVRGLGYGGLSKMLKLPRHIVEDHPELLTGRVGTDMGFGSCGSSNGTGESGKPVQLEILAPKGTKAMYVEPFSVFGAANYGLQWDGEKRQDKVSRENETILQRGTSYQILSAENKNGQLHLKVAIVDQTYSTKKYNKPAE